jgi:valyl-tRNA synthetase
MSKLDKTYEPALVETEISAKWEKAEIGRATGKSKKKVWAMMMPPANVTGALHLGHAITLTVEDILARYQRMKGADVLWLPGTDHAGIATQNVVEKQLREKQGIFRENLDREKFIEKVWEWKEIYHQRITEQIKKMGASCDWSRERFTLDENCSKAVSYAFMKLHKKGLIYRDKKLVNWCPRCQTVLSDIEVEHFEEEGNLYFIRYFVNATDRSICVSTTRPETMLGDTGVAVHPDDNRYSEFVGKNLILPIINREVRVIADHRVDPKFGTGAVKITPAHDPLDAEIGNDHGLESIVIIGPHGKLTRHAGKHFRGMSIPDARKAIVQYLDNIGNLEKITKHNHSVGHCSRCNTIVEPLESLQWFIKMQPLAEKTLKLIQKGELQFVPNRFEKEFTHWLTEIRDWCVSRQIWWGHQLPVWYCKKVPIWEDKRKKSKHGCQQFIISEKKPKKCPGCGNLSLTQDADVLDTWFSSGIWPFATLGWPNFKSKDLANFYPNTILETGYDILFFWVARMIMLGLELTKKLPFKTVYLHGLVRDEKGRKMSKSAGNGIDPLAMIKKYGTDSLRLSLVVGSTPGTDLKFSETKVIGQRNFINKLWNASRFVLEKIDKLEIPKAVVARGLIDKWILSKLNRLIMETSESLEKFAFAEAASKIQDFVWHDFCDWYLELTKEKPNKKLLTFVLAQILRLSHPFVPFVSEKIWGNFFPKKEKLLAKEKWPLATTKLISEKIENEMKVVIVIISTIRSARNEFGVEPAKKVAAIVHAGAFEGFLKKQAPEIKRLARLNSFIVKKTGRKVEKAVAKFEAGLEIYLPLAKLVNPTQERKRLNEDLNATENYLRIVDKKFNNENFAKRAPKNIIESERKKKEEIEEKIKKIKRQLEILG